jgi:hypothetical protein
MTSGAGDLPQELLALSNEDRVALIQGFPVADIVSPPGHHVLRSRQAMEEMSEKLQENDRRPLSSEPILLNIYPEQTKDGSPGDLTVHCIDGTHRLVAGLHAGVWQVIGDVISETLEVWVEGWAAGDTSGPRPRWIPMNVVQASSISDWVDVSSHEKARGPSAQIRGDISNDSLRFPMRHRGVRIETVRRNTIGE